jgi:hypothetical protein
MGMSGGFSVSSSILYLKFIVKKSRVLQHQVDRTFILKGKLALQVLKHTASAKCNYVNTENNRKVLMF